MCWLVKYLLCISSVILVCDAYLSVFFTRWAFMGRSEYRILRRFMSWRVFYCGSFIRQSLDQNGNFIQQSHRLFWHFWRCLNNRWPLYQRSFPWVSCVSGPPPSSLASSQAYATGGGEAGCRLGEYIDYRLLGHWLKFRNNQRFHGSKLPFWNNNRWIKLS